MIWRMFIVVLFSGCAVSYPPHPLATGDELVFQRNSGFAGPECLTSLVVNGQFVTILAMNEVAKVEMAEGENLIEVAADSGQCSNFAASRIFNAKQRQTLRVVVIKE